MKRTPDYIVVGGGSTGCTLAGRLTEDKDTQVTLIEQGPMDRDAWIHFPVMRCTSPVTTDALMPFSGHFSSTMIVWGASLTISHAAVLRRTLTRSLMRTEGILGNWRHIPPTPYSKSIEVAFIKIRNTV